LIEDGMTEEEALLAVEPQFDDQVHKNDFIADKNNPFKLKKCSIRLRKLAYIELALDLGCKTIWIPPKDSNRNIYKPKPVW